MNIKEMTGDGATWKTFFISAASLLGILVLICAWLWRHSRLSFYIQAPIAMVLMIPAIASSAAGWNHAFFLWTHAFVVNWWGLRPQILEKYLF